MRKTCKLSLFSGVLCLLIVTVNTGTGWTQSQNSNEAGSTRLQQRIDFGNAYIMGQSIKSGAVYLLHRKQSDIKSMLQYRDNYRQEILEDFIIEEEKLANAQVVSRDSKIVR